MRRTPWQRYPRLPPSTTGSISIFVRQERSEHLTSLRRSVIELSFKLREPLLEDTAESLPVEIAHRGLLLQHGKLLGQRRAAKLLHFDSRVQFLTWPAVQDSVQRPIDSFLVRPSAPARCPGDGR